MASPTPLPHARPAKHAAARASARSEAAASAAPDGRGQTADGGRQRTNGGRQTGTPSNEQRVTSNAGGAGPNNEQPITSNAGNSASDNEQPITNNATRRLSGLVRPANRAAESVSFDAAVVSFFVDAADMLGVPKSVAAIYGICFASAQPLSFSDINERLDISSGSISQGLRVLREVGALKVAGPRAVEQSNGESVDRSSDGSVHRSDDQVGNGSVSASRDFGVSEFRNVSMSASQRAAARYEPDLELRSLVLHWIEKRLQGQLSSSRTRLKQIVASIPQNASTATNNLQVRFDSLQTWQDKAHSLLPIAKAFLKLT